MMRPLHVTVDHSQSGKAEAFALREGSLFGTHDLAHFSAAEIPVTDHGNLFHGFDAAAPDERFDALLTRPGLRIERIVSTGQATPPGQWLDQASDEWVVLLKGAAGLLIEGDSEPRVLSPGDWIFLPAHRRHRVEWTAPGEPSVWLAVHVGLVPDQGADPTS
jgi:cupin 2 domain-containing protein